MNILDKLFNRNKSPANKSNIQRIDVMNGSPPIFTPFSGDAYSNDLYRSGVDAIAKNFAKLVPTHVITQSGQRKDGDSTLNYILQTRPNPYMNTYDFLYKMATHYFLYNNSFAYLSLDGKGNLSGIYPLSPLSMEFVIDVTGTLYCKFLFLKGREFIVEYSQVVLLRRFYNSNDLLGDDNKAIMPTLDLAHTQNQGMENSIKTSAQIRGLLKYNQVLSSEKLKEAKEDFIKDYLSIENNGGIAALDTKMDYQPIENKPVLINGQQLDAIKNRIYSYLGVSESIINCTYTEDEWSAFYESTIEPLSTQMSLELTGKLFTQREQSFGNSILLESDKLQFTSNTTKITALKELMPLGLLTINQALEILNLPGIEDGDRRLQTLNVADTNIVNKYQMGGKNPDEGNQNSTDKD
ncbi:phage portal protein [Clostridium kluyveri]|uniref:Portal protein n=1 Tax=Clostridium kluyveri TaxID=1534 RepID=A0A1L5F2X8_CLOKL|nr:phage portal protein [Clostridium kluyveri]APM37302.1 portal protein [Clostridium kluyveri]